jgi:hypothetical protein
MHTSWACTRIHIPCDTTKSKSVWLSVESVSLYLFFVHLFFIIFIYPIYFFHSLFPRLLVYISFAVSLKRTMLEVLTSLLLLYSEQNKFAGAVRLTGVWTVCYNTLRQGSATCRMWPSKTFYAARHTIWELASARREKICCCWWTLI